MKIPTFSLPSSKTCPNKTKMCEKYCYAKKAERMYPATLPSRERNYDESKEWDFIRKVVLWILKHKPKYFRIHESGDFYSQEYFDKWCFIAGICQDTKFIAYTQVYDLNLELKPKNLTIYWTVWPDSKDVPIDGLHANVTDNGKGEISNELDYPNYHICPKEVDKNITCDNSQ